MSRRKRAEPVTFVRSPTTTKPVSGPMAKGSSPAERGLGASPRRQAPPRAGDLARVLGRGPAAPADDVDEPVLGEAPQEAARVPRLLVVQTQLVRKARVRMARRVGRRDAREVLDERTHLRRSERAVDSDDERLGLLDREPEGLDRLAREVAAGAVDRREGDPERQLWGGLAGGDERRLRVQRVEDGLDQEELNAPVAEGCDLLLVCCANLVEGDGPKRGIVHPGGERQGHVERPDGPGDEAWLLRRSARP